MISDFHYINGKVTAALSLVVLIGVSGCIGPTKQANEPKMGHIAVEPAPEVIKLDYLSIAVTEEKIVAADWSRVMAAIESAGKELGLQPTGTTEWQDGRAFPMYEGDGGEVVLLMQCIRRTSEITWIQLTFFEGPEKDKAGRVILRNLPRGSALSATFWTHIQRYLEKNNKPNSERSDSPERESGRGLN